MKLISLLLLSMAGGLVAVPFIHHEPAGSWSIFRSTPQRGATLEGLSFPLALQWTSETGDAIVSSPAVVGGVVFVGSYDNYLYALDAESGGLLWRFETGGAVVSSPAVYEGRVYVGSHDGIVYTFDGDVTVYISRVINRIRLRVNKVGMR